MKFFVKRQSQAPWGFLKNAVHTGPKNLRFKVVGRFTVSTCK